MWHRNLKVALAVAVMGALVGCSADLPPAVKGEPEVYTIHTRKLPPEPVYNRIRWGNPPDIAPSRELPLAAEGHVIPVITMNLKNATLEEASRSLAATAQYASYCSSLIAKQKISFNQLGTLDELAEAISRQAGIRVVVDHEGQAIRFLPQEAETPRFFEQESR